MKNKKILLAIPILVILLLSISFGYSKLMATLAIDSDVNLSEVVWDIELTDLVVTDGSFTNNDENYVRIDPTNTNKLTYNITLNTEGDFYEFTVKLKNKGTIPGKLKNIITLDEENIPSYINYSIDGLPPIGSKLDKKSEKNITVRFDYMPGVSGSEVYTVTDGLEFVYERTK